MARSALDATRFTATHPHVAAKPQSSTNLNLPDSIPANETPQERVTRLRAALAKSRQGQESRFDQIVLVGRRWADRSHRVAALSLIGLTVICAAFSSLAIGDMLMHNRRKRNEWLAQKQQETIRDTDEARRAVAAGNVTEDQMLLLNRERAAQEAEARRTGVTPVLGSSRAAPALDDMMPRLSGIKESGLAKTPTKEGARRSAVPRSVVGGPLDVQGEALAQSTRSWFSWALGRS